MPETPHAPNAKVHPLRQKVWRIIFLSDTTLGKLFDIVLLITIVLCVAVVMIESVPELLKEYHNEIRVAEWIFTIIFTVEYGLRLWCVRNPWRYAVSFFGIVDLLSVLPLYLEVIFLEGDGSRYLIMVRILRLLRMFRVLKMAEYLSEASVLMNALRASRRKILVFLYALSMIICVEGSLMYAIEHDANPGFDSIPTSIYWSIVTITTVGYGDVVPVTVAGKMMASVVMLTGFAILAVPTGIVTAEISMEVKSQKLDDRVCRECGTVGHNPAAIFCHHCGTRL